MNEGIKPPEGYKKKIIRRGESFPLIETFSSEQIARRVSFYHELNRRRAQLGAEGTPVVRRCALHGWENTTTVRVYLRETVIRIATELFNSDYEIEAKNVNWKLKNGGIDRDHGHVEVAVRAAASELAAFDEYIRPGASFYVYDGEEVLYVPGDTSASEFIIVKPDEPVQPQRYWRRSQSFISWIEELGEV
jgi:hypothetical protein